MALQRALSWLTHQSVASDYEEFVGRGRMAASVRQNVIDRMTYQVRGLLMPSDAFRGLRMPSEAF